MTRFVLFFSTIVFSIFGVCGVPIETPDIAEENKFVIKTSDGWGYRALKGENGLIGVLWPIGTSFNSADCIIFVFLQDDGKKLPEKPDNINLFTEKCPKANFKFFPQKKDGDKTLSIGERYFSGLCGRTMVLFEEKISEYTLIVALVSGKYVSKKQLNDAKEAAKAYKEEIKKYIVDSKEEKEKKNDKTS